MINIQSLKNMSSLVRYEKGSVIIQEGDTKTNTMFIMLQGTVGVYKNQGQANEICLATLGPGHFFGEMSLFINKERTATVVTHEQVIALVIERHNAYDFFEHQPEATYSLIKTLCTRIDDLNRNLSGIQEDPAAPGEQTTAATASKGLFPEGHKGYTLEFEKPEAGTVYEKKYQCPFCMKSFQKLAVRQSALKMPSYDQEVRPRYKGIEPLYYEVVTCPSCFLSTFATKFESASVTQEQKLFDLLSPFKEAFDMSGEVPQNADEVFAGLYMALLCAPMCFPKHVPVSARVWQRIAWMYGDCGDSEMEMHAVKQAMPLFMSVYQNENLDPETMLRIQLILGDYHFRTNDLKIAAEFYFKVKTSKQAAAAFVRIAENRLNDIRDMRNNVNTAKA